MKRSYWLFVRGSCVRIHRPMKSGEGVITTVRRSISEGTIRLLRNPPTRGFTGLWNRIVIKDMKRAVGEIFDFNGVRLRVKDIGESCFCYGCYFNEPKRTREGIVYKNQTGECFRIRRTDDKNVIFVEVDYDKEK